MSDAAFSTTDERIPLWVVYDHPIDFPDSFVVRRWWLTFPEEGDPFETPAEVLLTARSLSAEVGGRKKRIISRNAIMRKVQVYRLWPSGSWDLSEQEVPDEPWNAEIVESRAVSQEWERLGDCKDRPVRIGLYTVVEGDVAHTVRFDGSARMEIRGRHTAIRYPLRMPEFAGQVDSLGRIRLDDVAHPDFWLEVTLTAREIGRLRPVEEEEDDPNDDPNDDDNGHWPADKAST